MKKTDTVSIDTKSNLETMKYSELVATYKRVDADDVGTGFKPEMKSAVLGLILKTARQNPDFKRTDFDERKSDKTTDGAS